MMLVLSCCYNQCSLFFFFKQKTAYEMRISDWSSDVCSSDLSIARVRTANREAIQEPQARAFVNAVQIYPFSDGALYRLYAAPERVTDIALQAGEGVISVAAGDTARWTVGDTTSGRGEAKRGERKGVG